MATSAASYCNEASLSQQVLPKRSRVFKEGLWRKSSRIISWRAELGTEWMSWQDILRQITQIACPNLSGGSPHHRYHQADGIRARRHRHMNGERAREGIGAEVGYNAIHCLGTHFSACRHAGYTGKCLGML